jgi:hypothetical protein
MVCNCDGQALMRALVWVSQVLAAFTPLQAPPNLPQPQGK